MKNILSACLLLALMPRAAQAQRAELPAAASVETGFQLSEPDGFRVRETFSRLEMPLGRSGGYSFRSSVRFARMSITEALSVPGELYKSGAELTAENGGKNFKLGIESNSDRPFYGLDTINLDLTYTFTLSEKRAHALLGGLNYSSQRSFARNIPLPFVVYRYQSGDFFMLFPFLYRLRLSEKVSLSVSYFPVRNMKASLRYKPGPAFHADLEAGSELDQFLLARRADESERFYYQRYTAALKPSLLISDNMRLACAAGYFFIGSYYSGKTYDDYHRKSAIGGAPYFNVSLKYTFGAAAAKPAAPSV